MLALAKPIHVQKTSVKLQSKKVASRRPVRSVQVRAALPNQDLVNYAQLQLVTWILPMTIASRFLKVEYCDWSHCNDCSKTNSRRKWCNSLLI
jgi:hypothetical protein